MSNALGRDLAKLVAAVDAAASECGHGAYGQRFHIMPPAGWLNDPNGLCQAGGVFHAYFQYAPFDVEGGVKVWGHATSRDLMTWDYVGAPLLPDEPFDCHGVYSGSALAEDGRIRVLYTGNVKLSDADGTYDYVNTGRRADTVYVESVDGLAGREFNQKRVVLASEDYPEDLTCHVRDPKVWRDADGRYHMVLGARRRVDGPHVDSRFCAMHGEGAGRDVGEILVYGSADMLSWELESRVSTPERFGFMWECPGYLELKADDGVPVKFLSFSPQGLEGGRWDRGNVYAAGYMPVTGDITGGDGTYEPGEFRLWDAGFDFYAPQEFTAEDGRHILIGWMGMPDEPTYGNAPTVACGWQHCMTVPRELTAGAGGVVLQQPVREIERHYASVRVGEGSLEVAGETCFDVVVDGVDGAFTATVDGELKLAFVPANGELPARFGMRFADEDRASAGCGRTVRWEPVDEVRNVRIVGDVSSVEVFVNDGALVFSTRIYPEAYGVTVDAPGASVTYHALNI